jgi:hypothetical protein
MGRGTAIKEAVRQHAYSLSYPLPDGSNAECNKAIPPPIIQRLTEFNEFATSALESLTRRAVIYWHKQLVARPSGVLATCRSSIPTLCKSTNLFCLEGTAPDCLRLLVCPLDLSKLAPILAE